MATLKSFVSPTCLFPHLEQTSYPARSVPKSFIVFTYWKI